MLSLINIRNLAIIEELELELGPGLNVLTGETGAGKSVIVSALELALGGKGKTDLVRTGSKQAEVELLFDVTGDAALPERLQSLGLEPVESELLIRRVLSASGRTRAYVNGRLVTSQQLSFVAQGLFDISSQHEHHALKNASSHINFLDAFAKLANERSKIEDAYQAVIEARDALLAFETQRSEHSRRLELLQFQVTEIGDVGPEPGEDAALSEQVSRLRHSDALLRLTADAAGVLADSEQSVLLQLAHAERQIAAAAELDASLTDLSRELEETRVQLEELSQKVERYAHGVNSEPEALASAEERLFVLGKLKRKYGRTLAEVLTFLETAKGELEALEDSDGTTERLRTEFDKRLSMAATVAERLSLKRRVAASKLAKSMSRELRALGMGEAQIRVDVSQPEAVQSCELMNVNGARLMPSGIDRVEFLIAANRGEPPRSLGKIASGGELSRAMLAIKCVLAELGPAGMYVFDEVDSGVGGAVAEVIGRKILEVSRHRQVLCITHLAQIAVYASQHFKVEKGVHGERTASMIRRLSHKETAEEVARMLGGVNITAKTRAAAKEMLQCAKSAA